MWINGWNTQSAAPRALLGLALTLAAVPPLPAQNDPRTGVAVRGEVRAIGNETLVAGARVTLASESGTRASTWTSVTDESGRFRFPLVPPGATSLLVRRLGFYPETLTFTLTRIEPLPVVVRLALQAPVLTAVIVHGSARHYQGALGQFNRRKDIGFGHFITRSQIERRRALRMSDLLRSIPGLSLASSGFGSPQVRLRDACGDPSIWLDGSPVGSALVFDLDAIPLQTVEGIEVYSGLATLPVELRGPRGGGRCGAIGIWTRRGERTSRRGEIVTMEGLRAQQEAGTLFDAEQVDRPAVSARDLIPLVSYPESLRENRTPGQVILEFVVDSLGRVEMSTVSVVTTTDVLLSEAVRAVLPHAQYRAAMLGDRRVRQVVQLPLRFEFRDENSALERR